MGLDTDIGNLIASSDDLIQTFNNKKTEIDSALQNALATLPETMKTFFIDQVNGDDTNSGTENSPLLSIGEALKRTAWNHSCDIKLMSDYHISRLYSNTPGGVLISSHDESQKVITFASSISPENPHGPGFYTSFLGYNFIRVSNIKLVAATLDPHINYQGMFYTHGHTFIELDNGEIDLPVNSNQFIAHSNRSFSLIVSGVITPANMAGRWIQGVAAGTSSSTLSEVASTNLPSF